MKFNIILITLFFTAIMFFQDNKNILQRYKVTNELFINYFDNGQKCFELTEPDSNYIAVEDAFMRGITDKNIYWGIDHIRDHLKFNITGPINEKKGTYINFYSKFKRPINLIIQETSDKIELEKKQYNLIFGDSLRLIFNYRPELNEQRDSISIIIRIDTNIISLDCPINAFGYHISSEEFREWEQKKTIYINQRRIVYLRVGDEALCNIYPLEKCVNTDQLVSEKLNPALRIPLSTPVNEFDISTLKPDKYLFRTVDFKNKRNMYLIVNWIGESKSDTTIKK